jgi:bacteriocin biosynthesis cyclodehydratase domain-containing protein
VDTNSIAASGWVQLPARFRVVAIADDGYKIVSLYESMRVRLAVDAPDLLGRILTRLVEGCTRDELERSVPAAFRQLLDQVLADLKSRGMLTSETPPLSRHDDDQPEQMSEQDLFFSNFRPALLKPPAPEDTQRLLNAQVTSASLKDKKVLVVGLGRLGARLTAGLAALGVGQIFFGEDGSIEPGDIADGPYPAASVGQSRHGVLMSLLKNEARSTKLQPLRSPFLTADPDSPQIDLLIVCDDGFDPELHRLANQFALKRSIPWIGSRNFGYRVETGPFIMPRQGPCWSCFELRRRSNVSSYDDFIETRSQVVKAGVRLGRLSVTLGYEVLVTEAAKVLGRFARPMLYGAVHTFDVISLETRLHPVLKVPRCPDCGAGESRPSMSIWDPGEAFQDL